MAAINEKSPSLDWRQFAAHFGNPILIRHYGYDKGPCSKSGRQQSQINIIGCIEKIPTHFPNALAVFNFKYPDPSWCRLQLFKRLSQSFCLRFTGQCRQGGVGQHGSAPMVLCAHILSGQPSQLLATRAICEGHARRKLKDRAAARGAVR